MKVVLVHDWLIHMRGGERVLEALAEMYPDAGIYTLFYHREKLSPVLRSRTIRASFLHYLPGIRRYYRWLLPLYPLAIRTLRIPKADVVISSSHCAAKAVDARGALHICYCHTPMRYLWGFGEAYFGNMPAVIKPLVNGILALLRDWDFKNNRGVDVFISNSENVRERIRKFYGRDAQVVYPPLNARLFQPCAEPRDFYLVVSAFVPYKRVDVVIEAFNELDRELVVVGSGPMEGTYRKTARSPKISFLGSVPDDELCRLYSEARALIFPTEEDFGIVPLEAQACGAPVIAYGKGGALESVKSGTFFDEQTPRAVRNAVLEFEKKTTDRAAVRPAVMKFDKENFKARMRLVVSRAWDERPPRAAKCGCGCGRI